MVGTAIGRRRSGIASQERLLELKTMECSREQLLEWDRRHYWHAFTQMAEYEPLVIERADGVWLVDIDGRRYLDGVSSMWCNVLGHRHPEIDRAILEQLQDVAHVTSLGMSHPTPIQLARRLAVGAPGDLEKVFYASDGACAVEIALKMAFQYWRQCSDPEPQRDLFLAVGNAYHGDTLGSVSVGGVARFHAMFDPLLRSSWNRWSRERREWSCIPPDSWPDCGRWPIVAIPC